MRWPKRPKPAPPPRIDPEVIQAWVLRRAQLEQRVHDEAAEEWGWLWSVRLRVLAYLIHQHGNPSPSRELQEAIAKFDLDANLTRDADSLETTDPYDRVPSRRDDTRESSDVDHPRSSRLKSLHELNEERRANADPIPPTPPPRMVPVEASVWPYESGGWRHTPHEPSMGERIAIKTWEAFPASVRRLLLTEIDPYTLEVRVPEEVADLPKPFASRYPEETIPKGKRAALEQSVEQKRESADALAEMDERGYKLLRQTIAYDLGLTELTDDILDEETIRAILAEHGLDQDETE